MLLPQLRPERESTLNPTALAVALSIAPETTEGGDRLSKLNQAVDTIEESEAIDKRANYFLKLSLSGSVEI